MSVKPLCIKCGTVLPSRWRRVCHDCQRNMKDEKARREAEQDELKTPFADYNDEDEDTDLEDEFDPEIEQEDHIPDGMVYDPYNGWYMP